MSQVNLLEMADILLPVPPEQLMPTGFMLIAGIAGLISIVIISFLLWRYLTQPIIQLERHLKQDKLSPREAAHLLDAIVREITRVKIKERVKEKYGIDDPTFD